ncbi:hypothetical protein GQ600_22624 [Phytophthora cactorum]|nr:hypothetical protein GQ600_22624 [Phytophthora cactorum]
MKFAAGLVLAAIAVTTVHAGNPSMMKTLPTDSESGDLAILNQSVTDAVTSNALESARDTTGWVQDTHLDVPDAIGDRHVQVEIHFQIQLVCERSRVGRDIHGRDVHRWSRAQESSASCSLLSLMAAVASGYWCMHFCAPNGRTNVARHKASFEQQATVEPLVKLSGSRLRLRPGVFKLNFSDRSNFTSLMQIES